MPEPILRVEGLTKRFGGLLAVHDVSLDAGIGEIHAIIGPNGAGKSTLINLLSGDLEPTSGAVLLDNAAITGWSPERIARRGVGRSYQKTNIFPQFTAHENCRLAAQSRSRSFRFLRPAEADPVPNAAAVRALAMAGLEDRADRIARTLSHGEQRQLEIAMTLATSPRLLLLDEPLAGMGSEEAKAMVALLDRLRSDHAIILVEHDMDAVFSLADRITVMADGALLASGPPDVIRASRAVQEAYLGVADDAHEG